MPINTPHYVERLFAQIWPPSHWQEVTVLLAVSGGADSVAMLRAVAALKQRGAGSVAVAHLNHQLRGEESAADEAFVRNLCHQLDLPCQIDQIPPEQWDPNPSAGLESAARAARYSFLERVASKLGARYVATAHSADDQAETILHRIVRGTGVGGLAGIPRVRTLGSATLIRPLLTFPRASLRAYLADLGQPYRADSSNEDPRFTRNRIRLHLLPELVAQYNPNAADALVRLGKLAEEVQAVITPLVDDLLRQAVTEAAPGQVRVQRNPLISQPGYLVRELLMAVWRIHDWPLQAMGFTEWDLLSDMLLDRAASSPTSPPPTSPPPTSPPRKRVFPGSVMAESRKGDLWLSRPPNQ